jgi:uncharacterized membrane-anchored protein
MLSARAGTVAAVLLTTAGFALADQGPAPDWVPGPAKVNLGSDVAGLDLPAGFLFANATDTRRLLERMGNTTDGSEVGLVTPQADDQDWMLFFDWKPEGYVKDDEKDKIDKDAILESYREGTEAGNALRKEKGLPGLHVTGWFEEPHYDAATHNLVWALRAKSDDGSEVVNYNARILGREGYMSVTLVDEPANLAASKPQADQLMEAFTYKSGKSYAEWRPGDKVAEYGLVALVAGGAGAAAAKLGLLAKLGKLFAKGGKLIVLAFVGLIAFIKKLFTGRSEDSQAA